MIRKPAAVVVATGLTLLALVLLPAALGAKGGNGGASPDRAGGGASDTASVYPAAVEAKGGNGDNPNRGGGKGGGGGGGGGGGDAGTLAVVMVSDQNGNGAPDWNDEVTFDVSTTATDRPWVRLDCYQAGAWVLTSNAGYFDAYPWAPNFTLASGAWTSGAGNCTAMLYMVTSNGRSKNLATLDFDVGQ